MPEIGEIRRGKEIGKSYHHAFIWFACIDCGEPRWITYRKRENKPLFSRCLVCSMNTSEARERNIRIHKGRHFNHSAETKAKLSLTSTGKRNGNWKGGKVSDGHGYLQVKLLPGDFFLPMANQNRYVQEHRLVVAKALGRCLHLWEIVHHKHTRYPAGSIEDKQDNRIDNLQLVTDDRHKQISVLELRIAYLEKQNEVLKARIKELENGSSH